MKTADALTPGPAAVARDGWAMLGRHLQRTRHNPGLLMLTQTMPIMMLLFFGYVFGSALAMPGEEYRSYLVPGLLAATAASGLMNGMFQAAQDTHRGVTDRLRTLPMSRTGVPLGQAAADLVTTGIGMVPLLLVGLAVGWRIQGGALEAAGAVALLLLFRFATTWVGPFSGCSPRARRRRASSGPSPSCCPCSPTPTSPPRGCRAGCARSPSGTRSAPSPRPYGTCAATRPCPRTRPGRSRTLWRDHWPGRWSSSWCSRR